MTINRETVLRLARQCGEKSNIHDSPSYFEFSSDELDEFAALLEAEIVKGAGEVVATTLPLPDGTLSESLFEVCSDRKFAVGVSVKLFVIPPSTATLQKEIDALTALLDSIRLQEVAAEIGLKLGADIAINILPELIRRRTELEQCKAENEFFYERGYRLGAQSGFNLGAKQDPLGLERLLAGHAYPRPQSATNGAIAAQSSEGEKG